MTFFKNLFKKQPIVQRSINLGKITATVSFRDGSTKVWHFVGDYRESYCVCLLGEGTWCDCYTSAQEMLEWRLKEISDNNFIKIDENTLLPSSEIAKITIERQDYFVETKRGQ